MSNVAQIKNNSGFSLQPANMAEAFKFAEMVANSELVPKQYKGRPQDTLVAMMMGHELGLNPIQSLQNIAVINGKPSIYGDALLALIQNHPKFGGIEETFDEQTMTATCTVWRKGGPKHTQTFSQKDAQDAGLWGKAGPWTQYKKRMLQMRARGFAVRDTFADALAGLITREEAEDMPIDVTPASEPHAPAASREPEALPNYPQADFDANFPKWQKLVGAGRKSADDVIATVELKGRLTEEQKTKIRNCAPIDGEATREGAEQ